MQVQTKLLTIAEYQAAYAQQPVEIVEGEATIRGLAGRRHSCTVSNLLHLLACYVEEHDLGTVLAGACYVLDADPDPDWVRDARTPDVSFIRREQIAAHNAQYPDPDAPWRLAPDLAVEVISPSDSYADIIQKVADYLRYGVRLVWVIDPGARTIRVHTPDQPTGHTLREGDTLSAAPVIEGWAVEVRAVFGEEEEI